MEARRFHSFYLLKDSFLPFLLSFTLFILLSGVIEMFESGVFTGDHITWFGFFNLIAPSVLWVLEYEKEWFNDVYDTSDTQGELLNVRIGFSLFIISEVMFFFSFSLPHPHNSIWVIPEFFGIIWPGANVPVSSSMSVALPPTVLLLTSSGTINIAIISLLLKDSINLIFNIFLTIFLGFLSIMIQLVEYHELVFGINDGISGSVFFTITGLHGFHVFLGLCFITLAFSYYLHFSHVEVFEKCSKSYVFLEVSAWYWHFVDFVWLLVYSWLYDWRVAFNINWLDSFKFSIMFF
jgi:heme/copper-type cytochrome/quinol oxidase subunit 3